MAAAAAGCLQKRMRCPFRRASFDQLAEDLSESRHAPAATQSLLLSRRANSDLRPVLRPPNYPSVAITKRNGTSVPRRTCLSSMLAITRTTAGRAKSSTPAVPIGLPLGSKSIFTQGLG